MPIKFFDTINPLNVNEVKKLEDQFNIFEWHVAKIHKVFSQIGEQTIADYKAPFLMLWCYYSSKPEYPDDEEVDNPEVDK